MKKYILVLLCLLGIAKHSNAQQYFNNEYYKNGCGSWGRSIAKVDSSYIIISSGSDADSLSINLGYLNVNNMGTSLTYKQAFTNRKKIMNFPGWSNSIVQLQDGSVIVGGTRQDTANNFPIIIKFKPNGDTAWYHVFTNVGSATTGQQIRGTADGGFLIAGEQYLLNSFTSPAKIIIIKTDSMGHYLWHQTYDNPAGFQNRIASFMKQDDNTFMIGHIYQNPMGGYAAGQVFAIDSIGNVKWQHQYNRPKDVGGMQVSPSNFINGYYITGFYDSIMYNWQSPSNNYVNYVARVDTSGNLIWRIWDVNNNKNEQKAFWYIKEIGGYLYAIGNVLDSSRFFLPSGMFCKIDSLGNLQWMQRYHAYKQTADSYLSDFVATDDGGFMLCGSGFDSTHHQSVWVVRVDSNGCEVANCLVDTSTGISPSLAAMSQELQLYPNPASELLVISYPLQVERVEIYDVLGQLNPPRRTSKLENGKIQLDVTNLASGVYFVKVIHQAAQASKQRQIRSGRFVKQ